MLKKSCLFLIVFLTLCSAAYCQKLSLQQLIQLQKNDLDGIHEALLEMGWDYQTAYNSDDNSHKIVQWFYKNKRVDGLDAKAWVSYLSYKRQGKGISYQTHNPSDYKAIKDAIRAYNMMKIDEFLQEGSLATAYEGANYVVMVKTYKSNNAFVGERTAYVISLYPKTLYYSSIKSSLSSQNE